MRELRDGRVIVLDARDQAVKLVDFKAGTAAMIGRKGSGPAEYQLPLELLPMPRDSSVIFDMANSAAPVVITPAGKAGDPLPGMRDRVGFVNIGSKVDDRGRIYRVGPQSNDQGLYPIERLDRATGKVDTVGTYSRRLVSPLLPPPSPGPQPRIAIAGKPTPFASFYLFDITQSGTVVLISPEPYHVTVIGPDGRRSEGPVIPFERLRVTEADKVEWRAERTKPVAAIMYNRGGGQTAGYQPARPVEEPDEWPEFLPAYITGSTSFSRMRIAPNGMIWVERAVNAGTPPLFDVLSPTGALVARVTLPKRTRLVGFGVSGIYAVRLDDDDLEYLQRFRFPAMNNR